MKLSDEQLLQNLHQVQSRNHIPKSRALIEDSNIYKFPNFSVEMETGTGKTYVYLRTIFELNKLYGFKKFIIVVPSVAIREGVTSSIKLMKEHYFNNTMVRLDAVGYWTKESKTPQAKITIFENTPNGPREKQIKIKHGTDLVEKTNRPDYEGYLVTNINAEPGNEYIEFQNGKIVELMQESGGMNDERLKSQIRQTIEQHFSKEKKFKDKGIKVLSLFFIDHIKSYRLYDDNGNRQKGKLALWFEELYDEISKMPMYQGLIPYTANAVHDGYFSADKKKGKVLDTSVDTNKDDETYEIAFTPLLNSAGTNYLTQEESTELWNHIESQGFIDKNGDFTQNFKPESKEFSLNLPYAFMGMDDAIISCMKKFLLRDFVKDARKRQNISYNKRIELNPDFKILWDKISQKTRYSVEFKTDDLIKLAADKIKKMAEIKQVQIEIMRAKISSLESS